MKNLLKIETLSLADMKKILADTAKIKKERGHHKTQPLAGQTWALMFSKHSTRTRVSFEVGIRELGGRVMFLGANDIQLGRGELIKDTARVMGRMIHGAVIRTFAQSDVEEFAKYSGIPTINALTDDEHPCQILADIFTFQEKRGSIAGKTVAFIGDGACNVANSWIWAAAKFGFTLRIAAPKPFQPQKEILKRAGGKLDMAGVSVKGPQSFCVHLFSTGGKVLVTDNLKWAANNADLLYTDVWISMGKEAEAKERIKILTGYQINAALVKLAKKDALVMHCLPAYRGKEIDDATIEAHADTIFEEAENRLHVQKAILSWAVS
jgi:ornithine carbamoyltransferase